MTIWEFKKLAKNFGLEFFAGKGYYYWIHNSAQIESVYVYRFAQGSDEFWRKELRSAIKQVEEHHDYISTKGTLAIVLEKEAS